MDFTGNQSSRGFIDKYKHSVAPALDYQFANDFYQPYDCRYNLVKEYIRLIFEAKQVQIYNCKIEYFGHDYFNVYLYIEDVEKIFGKSYDKYSLNKYTFYENTDYADLFYKSLDKFPIIELQKRMINDNGVVILDYTLCVKSFALDMSLKALNETLKKRYTSIRYITCWDITLYIFFSEEDMLHSFQISTNANRLKQMAYHVIKEFDIDHVWSEETLIIMLDDFRNYQSSRQYFDSEAMFSGVFI